MLALLAAIPPFLAYRLLDGRTAKNDAMALLTVRFDSAIRSYMFYSMHLTRYGGGGKEQYVRQVIIP